MWQQIILRTPVWVWAILAFLVYRGIAASNDREIRFKKIFIIPVVMLALSIQGIVTSFGIQLAPALVWLASIVAASLLTRRMFNRDSITADPQRGTIFQQGSWIPMMLMMGIFFTKYMVAILLALQPGHRESGLFVGCVCVLYGLFNGVFIGKTLGMATIYLRARARSGERPFPLQ